MAEAAVLALVPAVVIPVAAAIAGRSYPPFEALTYSALLLSAGIVFLFLSIFYSSLLGPALGYLHSLCALGS